MKSASVKFYRWSEMPPLPPPGQPVLIRVATSAARSLARQELRNALRKILAAWANMSPGLTPLRETSRGPVWPGELGGHALDISFSYEKSEGWIALLRAGRIGVDASSSGWIQEAQAVARHYFDPGFLERIRESPRPMEMFALAWTDLEARVKCVKSELTEWSPARTIKLSKCHSEHLIFCGTIVTVATMQIKTRQTFGRDEGIRFFFNLPRRSASGLPA